MTASSYVLNGVSVVVQAGVVGAVLLGTDDSHAGTVTVPGGTTTVPTYTYSVPPTASSGLIYNWSGTCASADPFCEGSIANATLTLTNAYTPGQALTYEDIASFSYSRPGGTTPLSLTLSAVGTTTSGTLQASAGDPLTKFDLIFQTAGQGAFTYDEFIVNSNGSWDLGWNLTDPGQLVDLPPVTFTFASGDGNGAAGTSSFSAPVNFPDLIPAPPNQAPEPGTIPLLALGLAGLWWTMRKKKNAG